MASAHGDALDWALALAKAPGERLVLRQRPLPEGVGALLQIAAGNSGQVLSSALARSGETEQGLVEAVRFYLREVLFHSGADAYRILGLERGASGDQAKAHHRWLQQWLHPDRHTSDWDAIFAGRVNAAWNQLRTEERRRVYDAEHPAAPVASHGPVPPLMAAWVRDDVAAPASTWQRWQRRTPLLVLVTACLGLSALALRDLARDEALLSSAVGDDDGGRVQAVESETDLFGALHLPVRAKTPTTKPVAGPAKAARKPPAADGAGTATRRDIRIDPAVPVRETAKPVGELGSQVLVKSRSAVASPRPTTSFEAQPGEAAMAPAAAPSRASRDAVASQPAPPTPSNVPMAVAQASMVGPAAPGNTSFVSAERVRQAQQVGDRLLAFMQRSSGTIPPIWDSLSAQTGAARLRDELLADGKPAVSQPDWKVGERDAQMQVAIRYTDGSRGRLNAGLVWREQRWLVTRLSMERDF